MTQLPFKSQNDNVKRECSICLKPAEFQDVMLRLFVGKNTEWAHARCAQQAIERWLLKKRGKL